MDFEKMNSAFKDFCTERDWDQFHSPKNLSMALAGESAELMEIFQWVNESESLEMAQDPKKRQAIKDELADIFIYLIRLSDRLDISLEEAFWEKLKKNGEKYPAAKARGSSLKYDQL